MTDVVDHPVWAMEWVDAVWVWSAERNIGPAHHVLGRRPRAC